MQQHCVKQWLEETGFVKVHLGSSLCCVKMCTSKSLCVWLSSVRLPTFGSVFVSMPTGVSHRHVRIVYVGESLCV